MAKVVQLTASIGKWFHKYIKFGKNDCLKDLWVQKEYNIDEHDYTSKRMTQGENWMESR